MRIITEEDNTKQYALNSGIDLSGLSWSSRSNTFTAAIVGKRYLVVSHSNTDDDNYHVLVGARQIWKIKAWSSGNCGMLFYCEATSTTIRVNNKSEGGYKYIRVALVE